MANVEAIEAARFHRVVFQRQRERVERCVEGSACADIHSLSVAYSVLASTYYLLVFA